MGSAAALLARPSLFLQSAGVDKNLAPRNESESIATHHHSSGKVHRSNWIFFPFFQFLKFLRPTIFRCSLVRASDHLVRQASLIPPLWVHSRQCWPGHTMHLLFGFYLKRSKLTFWGTFESRVIWPFPGAVGRGDDWVLCTAWSDRSNNDSNIFGRIVAVSSNAGEFEFFSEGKGG